MAEPAENMAESRRNIDKAITEELVSFDAGVIKINRASLAILFFLFTQLVGGIWYLSRLDAQVSEIAGLQVSVSTALTVLGDHGTELLEIRTEDARIREALDEIRADMKVRTRDRFTAGDFSRWLATHEKYLSAMLMGIKARVEHIEDVQESRKDR